jgi:HSP20 family molecular chaperone IbpA
MRSIERAVQLPSKDIDCDAISATAEHGMLCICVPKMKPADQPAPLMIPVRTTCALKK